MSIKNEKLHSIGTFKCFMCGICCKKFRVVIDVGEGNKLAEKMGLDWEIFKSKYLESYYVATDRFLIRQIDDRCIFLYQVNKKQALCRINSIKPSSCFEWQAGTSKHECRIGLKQIWDLDVDPDGQIMGIEANVRNFDLFINSIE
jgi:Fe-S-cluster containining protein